MKCTWLNITGLAKTEDGGAAHRCCAEAQTTASHAWPGLAGSSPCTAVYNRQPRAACLSCSGSGTMAGCNFHQSVQIYLFPF